MPPSRKAPPPKSPRKPRGKTAGPAYAEAERRVEEARAGNLPELDLRIDGLTRIPPLAGLTALQSLDLRGTQVSDLAPLAGLTSLIEGAASRPKYRGLSFVDCPLSDSTVLDFARLENPERTIKTINYLRELQGLPPYEAKEGGPNRSILPKDAPHAIDGVPSPLDFDVTERGTITLAPSDTNLAIFPFAAGPQDHARRLEACRVLANDLVQALLDRQYDNVRREYLSYLQRYLERLPTDAGSGNMLLADAMARALHHLFNAEADALPAGFAAELRTMLEQHIALSVYYPEIGTFNRDVRDGKPSRAFPLEAVTAVVRTVEAHTPRTFEPPVSRAFADVQDSMPSLPQMPVEPVVPARDTILPPPLPGGTTDPTGSREFATAGSVNRVWAAVERAASIATVGGGLSIAAHELAPHVQLILQWLQEIMKTLG